MKWPNRLVSAAVLAVLLPLGTAWAQPTAGAPPDTVRALVVQYADGFKTVTPIGTSGRVSWTPRFPRVPGVETSRDGLPLNALQFEEALDGQAVVVTIALCMGARRGACRSRRSGDGAQPVRGRVGRWAQRSAVDRRRPRNSTSPRRRVRPSRDRRHRHRRRAAYYAAIANHWTDR